MKKLLAIMLALVLCLSCVALIACEKCEHEYKDGVCTKCGEKDPDYKPGPVEPDVEIPVADGKLTVYLTLDKDSVAIDTAYAGIYFIGGSTGWDPATNSVLMTKIGDSNVYYAQITYDASVKQADEYKVGLGYTTASGLASDKLGITWTLVSDQCPTDTNNLKFTVDADGKKANLGAHKFSKEISAPVPIDEIELRVTFSAPLGANAEVFIMGGFNNWDAEKAKATPNTARDVWSIRLENVLATNYEYKILVYKDGSKANTLTLQEQKKDDAGQPVVGDDNQPVMEDLGIWDRYVTNPDWTTVDPQGTHEATDRLIGYTVISAGTANLPILLDETAAELDGYQDLAGTRSETFDELVKTGIDLSEAKLIEGQDTVDDQKVPNGKFTWTVSIVGEKTLTVKFATALDANTKVFIAGSLENWTGTEMTIAENRLSASYTAEVLPGSYEFKLIFFHKDIYSGNVWAGGAEYGEAKTDDKGNTSMGNATLTVVGFEDEEVDLFSSAITVPAIPQPDPLTADVTLTVKFDKVDANRVVVMKGAMTGWAEKTFETTDNQTYSLTLAKEGLNALPYEFIVGFGNSGTADFYGAGHKIAGEGEIDAGSNSKIVLPKEGGTVALYSDKEIVAELVGEPETVASVTLTITLETTKNVFLVGNILDKNWTIFQKMTAGENNTYSITLTNVVAGTYEYKIILSDNETTSWNDATKTELTAEGGNNAKLTIASDSTTIVLSEIVLPVAQA